MTIRLVALILASSLVMPAAMATPPAHPPVDCKDSHNKDKPECKGHADDHGKKPH